MPKICLNMIVKNESRVIERLMTTVLPLVDSYCICDTGSTDNTIEMIESFFAKHNKPGKIVKEPFRDFGYNRTFALNSCVGLPDADYLLLLDADMKLRIGDVTKIEEFKAGLTKDAYYIFQGCDTFFYKNVRILRNDASYSYWGVTHEFVSTPHGTQYQELERSVIFIDDIGDGGAKSDKYERDIRLLTKGLEENPKSERYTFYLANSYTNVGNNEKAIEYYRKRIELGGWIEEIWYSYYNIGRCYKNMGDMVNAAHAWLEGYQRHPVRIENLYLLCNHYRSIGSHVLAHSIYEMAEYERNNNKSHDFLFLEKDIYDFKLDYEFTIIAYYRNTGGRDVNKSCMKVLSNRNSDENINKNILSNYKFYSKALKDYDTQNNQVALLHNIGDSLVFDRNDFVTSTPSIYIDPYDNSKLLVNLRYVNYSIDDKGGYVNKEQIVTKNVVATFDIGNGHGWKKMGEFELKYNQVYDNVYVGLEDVRLFINNETVYFNANRGLGFGNMFIESGIINMNTEKTVSNLLEMENQHQVEKNWVLFKNSEREIKVIYGWYPLTIGNIEDHPQKKIDEKNNIRMGMRVTDRSDTPNFFRWVRGSTNGVTIGNEVWVICHVVSYEDRRYYYHLFVVLDKTTMKLKKYSQLFTFEKEKVEYTLGFGYLNEKNEFLIGYSVMDRKTKYITVNKENVDKMFYVL